MTAAKASAAYRFGRFELQPEERRLLASGDEVRLGAHAFDVLLALVERSGHLVTKDELLQRVWGKVVVAENTLQVHISALRKVFGADAIATVSGRGYRFTLAASQSAVSATATAAPAPKHNLPHDLTSFIGREQELAEIAQLLGSTRLLTLTGSGGCGKTRLAIQLAKRHAHAYPDGAWMVELAELTDAALLPQVVGAIFGIKERAGAKLIDGVAEYLASRTLLLLLDNAEHLIDACAQLAESLLRRCARLVILVTSRERLAITGEQTYRVPSLAVPVEGDATPEAVAAYESARLFIERARLQQPHFAVTTQNSTAIASICRRLDGIALALELAAPRVRTLSVEELSRSLDRRFDVLTEGSRTALPRHRTLRALIDWSYDLLTDAEQAMLRRLSIFSGGWTLEAAMKICSGDDVQETKMLDVLTSLVDKNLVLAEASAGVARYGLLETVRHYARGRLRDSGEEARVAQRHLEYFSTMADNADREQSGAKQSAWVACLETELDNLRAALSWAAANVEGAAGGLQLAAALSWFWWLRGYFSEGRRWLAALLTAVPDSRDSPVRANALRGAARLAAIQGDRQAAQILFERALALYEGLGDRRNIAYSLNNLGTLARARGEYAAATAWFERAVAIERELNDRPAMVVSLCSLGQLARSVGDYPAARLFIDEAVMIGREIGDWRTAHALYHRGELARTVGDYPAAQTMLEEALAMQRDLGFRAGIAGSLVPLAVMARKRGDFRVALALLKEALTIQCEIGAQGEVCGSLLAFGGLALALAKPGAAVRIWGAMERLREETEYPLIPIDRSWYERKILAARAALGDDAAFDIAWSEGRAMTGDQAVKYALELDAADDTRP